MPEADWVDGADSYLVHLAPFYGPVARCSEPLAYYRSHAASVSNSTSGPAMNIVKLEKLLRSDLRLRDLLERFTAREHLNLAPEAVFCSWPHLKLRLALRKLKPNVALFPTDRLPGLTIHTVRMIWRSAEISTIARLGLTLWTILVAILPVKFADALIRIAFSPASRPRLVGL
jgi:hypothetical protein